MASFKDFPRSFHPLELRRLFLQSPSSPSELDLPRNKELGRLQLVGQFLHRVIIIGQCFSGSGDGRDVRATMRLRVKILASFTVLATSVGQEEVALLFPGDDTASAAAVTTASTSASASVTTTKSFRSLVLAVEGEGRGVEMR